MSFKTIATERIALRAPRSGDLAGFLAYRNHPDNLRYQPVAPVTEDWAAAFLARQAVLDIDAGPCWMMCALELPGHDGIIGEVGIWFGPARERTGNIGWSLHPDFQGRGLATEAARALLGYVFRDRDLHRVTATSDTRNAASTRVMDHLGMRREGTTRQSQFTDGAWRDAYQYAILQAEWHAKPI